MWELGNATSKNKQVILIADDKQSRDLPPNLSGQLLLTYSISVDNLQFVRSLDRYLSEMRSNNESSTIKDDPQRLLVKREYTAAAILVFRLLETTISNKFIECKMVRSLNAIDQSNTNDKADQAILDKVRSYKKVRNRLVHTNTSISKKEATDIVNSIEALCNAIISNKMNIQNIILDRG